MQKKNWIIVSVFVLSIISWITFDSLKQSVILESGKDLARYEASEKSFLLNFEGLSKALDVVQNDSFNYRSSPQVELEKEEFLKKAPQEIIAVFKPDLSSCVCSTNTITAKMMFVKDSVMYFTNQTKKVELPKLSKFEKVEYVGNGNLSIHHVLDSSKISYGGWFTVLRIVAFIVFCGCIFYWVLENTFPVSESGDEIG